MILGSDVSSVHPFWIDNVRLEQIPEPGGAQSGSGWRCCACVGGRITTDLIFKGGRLECVTHSHSECQNSPTRGFEGLKQAFLRVVILYTRRFIGCYCRGRTFNRCGNTARGLGGVTLRFPPSQPSPPRGGSRKNGHETITQGVVQDRTEPATCSASSAKLMHSSAPSRISSAAGNHFINIDSTDTTTGNAGTVSYSNDFANFRAHTFTFPVTTANANARYGSAYISSNGGLPWLANAGDAHRQNAVRHHLRRLVSLAPHRRRVAHYIEDMHQPLHLTTNYNPSGLHARCEGGQFEVGVSCAARAARLHNVGRADVLRPYWRVGIHHPGFNRIPSDFDKIRLPLNADATAKTAGPIDSAAYYDSLYSQTKAVTEDSFQNAANVIRYCLVANGWTTRVSNPALAKARLGGK